MGGGRGGSRGEEDDQRPSPLPVHSKARWGVQCLHHQSRALWPAVWSPRAPKHRDGEGATFTAVPATLGPGPKVTSVTGPGAMGPSDLGPKAEQCSHRMPDHEPLPPRFPVLLAAWKYSCCVVRGA